MEIYQIANGITIITSVIAVLINLSIIRMHVNQPLLKDGFFNVVFGQIITELIVNSSLLLLNIFYLIMLQNIGKFIIIFPILFNLGYVANIVYNIRILIFLFTYNTNREELINYAMNNNDPSDNISHQASLVFVTMSFKNFHYLSFGISIIHTIIYILNLLLFQKVEIQSAKWNWYYYFMCGQDYWWRIIFFLPHFLFFILSFIYLIKSCNKNKISDHIYLRSFALYAFFSSFISLFFPLILLIFWLGYNNDPETINTNYFLILLIAFFGFLFATSIYRLECYYVNYILTKDGKNCLNRWGNAFKILFCRKEMEPLNFVDLNSSFIYHALSSANDFLLDTNEENIEGTQMVSTEGLVRNSNDSS